ncbi:SusF/SusE family outer membrane protein [Marinilabilia sp.]|uniref:SusF/SusE family outer membrane protein n=1 Tax=Marinilabilia sp. TaxID=2021252 RepID=UPI0025C5C016|nr:SusF/SusE family outer membrane protein [Marinilabilia sp.]
MKKINKYGSLGLVALLAIFSASCTEEMSELRLEPSMKTTQSMEVTSATATVEGFIVAGSEDFTEKGICYSTSQEPTVEDSKVVYSGDETGATFMVTLSGLDFATKYYARAYGVTPGGTLYGDEVTFTTKPVVPTVVTVEPTEVTSVSAVIGGNVTADGGGAVTATGICYSTNPNPDISQTDSVTVDGEGMGEFVSSLIGLSNSTTYYVRAYATNSAGTAYGEEVSFTTLSISKFWLVGDYNGWNIEGEEAYIISTPSSGGLAEGYAYLTAGGLKLSTDHTWDEATTFGDDGSGGLTNPGDNISVPEDGYYLVQASLAEKTYTLVKTEWGVIGDATPGGWDTDTNLSYNQDAKVWQGGVHLTAGTGTFKFRANDAWTYDYGSTAGDNTLDAGGSNIPVAMEADYSITLDLSTPNEYTYSAHHWGIIGSATPGGWDNDTNMTWDEVNEVFTVTLDLLAGEYKIRADDAWDLNYGGDLNALIAGGDNMVISDAGNYTITFDPWALVGSLTQN